jgi:hypothetical protein
MKAIVLAAAFAVSAAHADTDFNKACPDIATCAEHVAALLGQHYMMDADVRGTAKTVGGMDIGRDNAELLFSKMLYLNGFTRVPLGPRDTFEIRRIRDAKDSALPRFTADSRSAPAVPRTWDLVTVTYKASHPESLNLIRQLLMNVSSPTVRLMASPLAGTLTITAPAAEQVGFYETVRDNDVKLNPLAQREQERMEERSKARDAAMAAEGAKKQ